MILRVGSALLMTGCATIGVPVQRGVCPNGDVIKLADYVGVSMKGRRAYLRTNLKHPQDSPELYTRLESEDRRAEGRLTRVKVRSMAEFLHRPDARNRVVKFPWPDKRRPTGPGFFIEFDPPVAEFPERVSADGLSTVQARMLVYDRAGNPFVQGTAVRRVKTEGFEAIEVQGTRHEPCLVIDSETALQFGWWATFRVSERLWLTEELGVVRRTERIQGTALIVIRFESAFQYDIVPGNAQVKSMRPQPIEQRTELRSSGPMDAPRRAGRGEQAESSMVRNTEARLPRWKRMAVYFDRDVPNPRLAGLLIEYDDCR